MLLILQKQIHSINCMRGFFFLLMFMSLSSVFGQVYKTEPLSDQIHTIQINKSGNWLASPVIDINQGEYIRLSFDRISEYSTDRLRYKVLHCNADWTLSSISEIDFIDGFNDNLIEDYAVSVNTLVDYTNFGLQIPNDRFSLKLSGNYVILVYEEDDPDNVLLSACFSVIDPLLTVAGNITSSTLIDTNREHHQISFTVNNKGVNINDPYSDLKVYVRQNERLDNQKSLVKPSIIQAGRLVYEQNRNLIFEAGNEYRRFEIVSHRYNGLRIAHLKYRRPFYYAFVFSDFTRSGKRYIYDEDQNGRFVVHNTEANNSDSEADYFHVQFSLQSENPVLGNVYVNGNFTNNTFNNKYLMQYDFEKKEYYLSLLLKQGAYNYQYLTERGNGFTTSILEGNYYETENKYQVFVYYRPMGQRYDSLAGYMLIEK